jgi:hypothetical protein
MALAGKETETQTNAVLRNGETPRSKYETASRASQKNRAFYYLSENPISACLAPMVLLAH